MQHRIVIDDPTWMFPCGDILEGDKAISLLHGQGGVTLPIEPELLDRNAVSGFFLRDWGRGVPYTQMVGTRGCSMLLYAMQDYTKINWVIRAEPIEGAHESKGTFRLATQSGQFGSISGGLSADRSAIEFSEQPIDERGGVIIKGTCNLNCTMEGYLGLCVYGCAVGIKVMWSAVTQTR